MPAHLADLLPGLDMVRKKNTAPFIETQHWEIACVKQKSIIIQVHVPYYTQYHELYCISKCIYFVKTNNIIFLYREREEKWEVY